MDPIVWIISDVDHVGRSLAQAVADAGYVTTLSACDDLCMHQGAMPTPALIIGIMEGWRGSTLPTYRALTVVGMPPVLLIFATPTSGFRGGQGFGGHGTKRHDNGMPAQYDVNHDKRIRTGGIPCRV